MIGTRQQKYRTGKAIILRRAAMSYERLMQVVTEQAMQSWCRAVEGAPAGVPSRIPRYSEGVAQ
jgi:hypothetical protein